VEASVPNKPIISIVDDDETVRETAIDLFKSMGFAAVAYSSAADFLNSNHRRSTSCLIADVQMRGMTGFELHNSLVALGNMIPTILITAYPDDTDQSRARQAGVICYLAKPINGDDLVACVRLALESDQRLRGNHD
jgi:FixJ family two-component response regulator